MSMRAHRRRRHSFRLVLGSVNWLGRKMIALAVLAVGFVLVMVVLFNVLLPSLSGALKHWEQQQHVPRPTLVTSHAP
jgi:hypothetical protein